MTHLDTLRQRRDWLTARIVAKQTVGWDVDYDTRERDALRWACDALVGCADPTPAPWLPQ